MPGESTSWLAAGSQAEPEVAAGDQLFDLSVTLVLTCALLGGDLFVVFLLIADAAGMANGSGVLTFLAALLLGHALLALGFCTALAACSCVVAARRLKKGS